MGKANKKNLFLFFFCAVLFFILVIFIYSPPKNSLYTVQHGEIREEFTSDAIFIREELVIKSQYSGQVNIVIGEGQRVRSGTTVMTIGEEKAMVYAFDTGVISFKHDGDENLFNPEDWAYLERELITGARNSFSNLRDGQRVREGQFLFRVVNNFCLYLAILFPPEQPIPPDGSSFRIEFPRLDREIYWVQVVDTIFRERIVIVELRQFIDEFLSLRTQPVNVVRGVQRGVVVPREAIVETDDGYAVLVSGRGEPALRKVDLRGGNANMVIVDGLNPGDEVYLQPDY